VLIVGHNIAGAQCAYQATSKHVISEYHISAVGCFSSASRSIYGSSSFEKCHPDTARMVEIDGSRIRLLISFTLRLGSIQTTPVPNSSHLRKVTHIASCKYFRHVSNFSSNVYEFLAVVTNHIVSHFFILNMFVCFIDG